jgi:hypothetical protein
MHLPRPVLNRNPLINEATIVSPVFALDLTWDEKSPGLLRRTECDEQGAKTAPKFQPFGESHEKGISEAADMKPPKG